MFLVPIFDSARGGSHFRRSCGETVWKQSVSGLRTGDDGGARRIKGETPSGQPAAGWRYQNSRTAPLAARLQFRQYLLGDFFQSFEDANALEGDRFDDGFVFLAQFGREHVDG